VPYFWVGIKAYDLVAGSQLLKPSYLISKSKALELFPMLKKDHLKGAIVYYDGQHNDARMNISMALTAARLGANVANYVAVVDLIHEVDENGKKRIVGAKCLDRYLNKEFTIRAKCVINATGPYTDHIRQMDDKETRKICQPSSGVHIVLPDYYSPTNMGLLDPNTSDGRVIFFLPWQKHTMAGTTDSPCEVTDSPAPSEDDVTFILNEIKNYLNPDVQVRRGDILSAWSGIRPLVSDPNKSDTQSLARNHIVHVSDNKLVTIAGGKWTTYRSMAQETVDAAIKACDLKPKNGCLTKGLFLEGGHNWTPTSFIRLVQDYGLETEVAIHLSNTYGDQADKVAEMSSLTGKRWPVVGVRLHQEFPYIDAEVKYAVKEYARSAVDVIARRTRMSFLNVLAADEALPSRVNLISNQT
jgi:glycerol-3-phosphate dehydrogenase